MNIDLFIKKCVIHKFKRCRNRRYLLQNEVNHKWYINIVYQEDIHNKTMMFASYGVKIKELITLTSFSNANCFHNFNYTVSKRKF